MILKKKKGYTHELT